MAKRKGAEKAPYGGTEALTRQMDIRPLEELVITVEEFDETIGKTTYHTVLTRRKGLHELTDKNGERVLADESAIMDSGPKYGTTLCYTSHRMEEVPEEVRAANLAEIKRVAAQVMVDMGIW